MEFNDLKFVRLKTDVKSDPDGSLAFFMFNLIPRYLFEQVKGAEYKVDRLYQFGPLLLASPLTFFYVLVDKESKKVKGVLWAEINPLDEQIKVHVFTVDKEYQQNMNGDFSHDSIALKTTLDFLRKLQKENNLDSKIEIVTLRPLAYEKAGWKQSKKTLMEV